MSARPIVAPPRGPTCHTRQSSYWPDEANASAAQGQATDGSKGARSSVGATTYKKQIRVNARLQEITSKSYKYGACEWTWYCMDQTKQIIYNTNVGVTIGYV